jgi:hypothetical protein
MNDDATMTFETFKLKKDFKYLVMKIKDSKEVVVDKCIGDDVAYSDFAEAELLANETAFIAINHKDRTVLLSWFPDQAKTKQKLMYSNTRPAIYEACVGALHMVATERSEATEEAIDAMLSKE